MTQIWPFNALRRKTSASGPRRVISGHYAASTGEEEFGPDSAERLAFDGATQVDQESESEEDAQIDNKLMKETELERLRLLTLNVRFNNNHVPLPSDGHHITPIYSGPWSSERPWSERRTRLVDAVGSMDPDVIGFQEVLHHQLHDLKTLLGRSFQCVGVGRDDGKQAGEYSPLFWRKDKFELVEWKTYWLSESGEVGSVGWDASQTRIATFVRLRRRQRGRGDPDKQQEESVCATGDPLRPTPVHRETYTFIAMHYDDQGRVARGMSSRLIRTLVDTWTDDCPEETVVLLGDLNSPPEESGYTSLLSDSFPGRPFVDSREALLTRSSLRFTDGLPSPNEKGARRGGGGASRFGWIGTGPVGPFGTYTAFDGKREDRIDFIFLATPPDHRRGSFNDEHTQPDEQGISVNPAQPNEEDDLQARGVAGGWEVVKHVTIDNLVPGSMLSPGWKARWSDHRAVFAEIVREVK